MMLCDVVAVWIVHFGLHLLYSIMWYKVICHEIYAKNSVRSLVIGLPHAIPDPSILISLSCSPTHPYLPLSSLKYKLHNILMFDESLRNVLIISSGLNFADCTIPFSHPWIWVVYSFHELARFLLHGVTVYSIGLHVSSMLFPIGLMCSAGTQSVVSMLSCSAIRVQSVTSFPLRFD